MTDDPARIGNVPSERVSNTHSQQLCGGRVRVDDAERGVVNDDANGQAIEHSCALAYLVGTAPKVLKPHSGQYRLFVSNKPR